MDGMPTQTLSRRTMRDNISCVLQNATIYSGTIRDNVRMGRLEAGDVEIREALEIAQAGEFVNGFSDGIDHMIRQSGKNLSGGQKQRLSIARALLKKCAHLHFRRQLFRAGLPDGSEAPRHPEPESCREDPADHHPAGDLRHALRCDFRHGRRRAGGQRHPRPAVGTVRGVPGNLCVPDGREPECVKRMNCWTRPHGGSSGRRRALPDGSRSARCWEFSRCCAPLPRRKFWET